jgi:phosphoglycerate dehydrogenase-like enzyme
VIGIEDDPTAPPSPPADLLLTRIGVGGRYGWATSVPWVELISTGISEYPSELFENRLVTCARGTSSVPIAEYVIAALLAHEKQIPAIWESPTPPEVYGGLGSLSGRTLGIVGVGSIAQEVARRATAFGMSVVGCRRTGHTGTIGTIRLTTLRDLLALSDHLVLAAPLTSETYRLISDEQLRVAKVGQHVINVARGPLIDTAALVQALERGHIGGATLDCTDPEPLPDDHALRSTPNVRISPHIAWSGPQQLERKYEHARDNLLRFLDGQPLRDVVDLRRGY